MAEDSDIGDLLIALLPAMRRFARSLCRRADLADDLVQEACERALGASARFEPGSRFDAWMFRIIRNLWIDRIRRDRTAGHPEPLDDRHDLAGADGERTAESRLMLLTVTQAMDELATEQREVLHLVCIEDLSYRETAEVLGIPIGTVMSRLARARIRLSELVGIDSPGTRSPGRQD